MEHSWMGVAYEKVRPCVAWLLWQAVGLDPELWAVRAPRETTAACHRPGTKVFLFDVPSVPLAEHLVPVS